MDTHACQPKSRLHCVLQQEVGHVLRFSQSVRCTMTFPSPTKTHLLDVFES